MQVPQLPDERGVVQVVVEVLEDEEGGLLVRLDYIQSGQRVRGGKGAGLLVRVGADVLVSARGGPCEDAALAPLPGERLQQPVLRARLFRRDQRDERDAGADG